MGRKPSVIRILASERRDTDGMDRRKNTLPLGKSEE